MQHHKKVITVSAQLPHLRSPTCNHGQCASSVHSSDAHEITSTAKKLKHYCILTDAQKLTVHSPHSHDMPNRASVFEMRPSYHTAVTLGFMYN